MHVHGRVSRCSCLPLGMLTPLAAVGTWAQHQLGRVKVGVGIIRGHRGWGLTVWHHDDLLHVLAHSVAQRAAHRQWPIHVLQTQCAHHLILLLLLPVCHVRLQLALLFRTVPQQHGRQLAWTSARRAGRVACQPLPLADRETKEKLVEGGRTCPVPLSHCLVPSGLLLCSLYWSAGGAPSPELTVLIAKSILT